MYMSKTSASQFKTKMGRYMKAVRAGEEVVITDRGEPVARLVPIKPALEGSAPVSSHPRHPTAPPLGSLKVRAIRKSGVDTLAILREERDRR